MKVYFENNPSKTFPLLARWTVNKVAYSSVFENETQAKNYFAGKYGIYKRNYDKTFVDRRG